MNDTGRAADITALMARRLRCPGCMRRFRTQDFSTIESDPRRAVFRLRCPMCHVERLIIATWNRSAVKTYTTDLDVQEWFYYRSKPAINADDVIRVARMFTGYEGDFSDVLEDPLFEPHDDGDPENS